MTVTLSLAEVEALTFRALAACGTAEGNARLFAAIAGQARRHPPQGPARQASGLLRVRSAAANGAFQIKVLAA